MANWRSQVPNALSPLSSGSFSHALRKTSRVSSSPCVRLPDRRVHSEYTRMTYLRYSRSNAWRSPSAARATSVLISRGTAADIVRPIRSSPFCMEIGYAMGGQRLNQRENSCVW